MNTPLATLEGSKILLAFHEDIQRYYHDLVDNSFPVPTGVRLAQTCQDEFRFLQCLDPEDNRNALDATIPDLGVLGVEMHIHPDSRVKYNTYLQELIERMQGNVPEMHVAMEDIRRVVELLGGVEALKGLARFVAGGQPPLTIQPTHAAFATLHNAHAESYNATFTALKPLYLEHLHRRALFRHLHYPGLIKWDSTLQQISFDRPTQFAHIYSYGRLLLEFELAAVPPYRNTDAYPTIQPAEDANFNMFDFVQRARPRVKGMLEECARVAWEEILPADERLGNRFFPGRRGPVPPVAGTVSRREVFEWNVKNCIGGLARRFMEKFNTLSPTHPLEALILSILTLETNLEKALAEEHIEDKLINKQISLLDEKALLLNDGVGLWDYEDMMTWPLVVRAEEYMFEVLKGIVGVGRQRRNLRLLRDWSAGRPWRFLFQLYDTSTPEKAWLRDAIETFHSKLNDSVNPFSDQKTPQQLESTFSSFARIGSHVFGIFPLDYTTKAPSTLPTITPCTLCKTPYIASSTPTSTIAQLHCKHTFHLSCLIKYWDSISLQTHRCPLPTCRRTTQLSAQRFGLSDLATSPDHNFVYNLDNWRAHNGHSQPPSFGRLDIPRHHFTAQEALAASIDVAPVKWRANHVVTEDGDDSVPLATEVNGNGNWERDPMAMEMADEWKARNEVQWQRGLLQARRDNGTLVWKIPGARWDGESEMAWMRRLRRGRDRQRRDSVRHGKRGVHGL